MLTLDLPRLEREGTLDVSAEIPADDPLWEGSELTLRSPLRVVGRASLAGSGEVLVAVDLTGEFEYECRRCLEPVVKKKELVTRSMNRF